jgi:hypothetical protein
MEAPAGKTKALILFRLRRSDTFTPRIVILLTKVDLLSQAERSVKEQILTVEHLLSRTRSEAAAIRSALDDVELLLRGVETPPA